MITNCITFWQLNQTTNQKQVKFRNLQFCLNVRKNSRRCVSLSLWFLFCCKCIPFYCFITPIVIQSVSEKDCNFLSPMFGFDYKKSLKCWKIDKFQSLTQKPHCPLNPHPKHKVRFLMGCLIHCQQMTFNLWSSQFLRCER